LDANIALNNILKPKSVAVIGASTDPFKWGHMLLNAIMKSGFEGPIYPINPRADEILGIKCYSSVKDIGEPVDMALVVVPARFVPNVFQDLVDIGTKGAVVITSGFSEAGEEGKKLIADTLMISEGNIRFIGPNCMGVTSSESKLSALMIPFLHERGEVTFISQSGGYGLQLYIRASAMGVGIGKFVSSGNESDIKGWNYLEYFGNDDNTKLIALYIEGLKNGRKWFKAAKEVSKKKPIVAIKVGVTEEGSKAAASHTGSIAGSDSIYDAAFKQAGVIRAYDSSEMFDYVKGLLYSPLPKGKNMAIVSNSGGVAVETADRLIKNGLNIPVFSEEAQTKIKELIPAFGNAKNPVDLTATLNMNSFLNVPDIVLRQTDIHGMISISLGTSIIKTMFPDVAEEDLKGMYQWINTTLLKTYKKYEKPVIIIDPSADVAGESAKILETANIPVYTTPERAADVMGVLYKRKLYLDKVNA
jgi:acetyltransferase